MHCSTKELLIHKDAHQFMEIATTITLTMRICIQLHLHHKQLKEDNYQLREILGYLWNQLNRINLLKWEFYINWMQDNNNNNLKISSNNNILQEILYKIYLALLKMLNIEWIHLYLRLNNNMDYHNNLHNLILISSIFSMVCWVQQRRIKQMDKDVKHLIYSLKNSLS